MAEDDVFPREEPEPSFAGATGDDALDLLAFLQPEPVPTGGSGDALAAFLANLDAEMAAVAAPDDPAAPPDPSPSALAGRCVVFNLGGARYALPLRAVLEMADTPAVTPVPFVPDWVLGVTNLRGDILAVLDLGALFELPRDPENRKGRLLVTRNGAGDVQAGLLVDAVHGITTIAGGELAPPGSSMGGQIAAFLAGIGEREGRLLALLDPDAIFASPEVRRLWQS